MSTPVPDRLAKLGDTFRARNSTYGDTFLRVGGVMASMFPDGLTLKTIDDWNRFSLFHHVVDKVLRYANRFQDGGHNDSMDDVSIYAQILRKVDDDLKAGGADAERQD